MTLLSAVNEASSDISLLDSGTGNDVSSEKGELGHSWVTLDYFQQLTPTWGAPWPGRYTNHGKQLG